MLYRIVIEAEGQDPQGLKEDLASALERYGPARVVAVETKEQWRQEGMFDRGPAASPWERADRAWDGVIKGLEHG